jgi:hypothetical protein
MSGGPFGPRVSPLHGRCVEEVAADHFIFERKAPGSNVPPPPPLAFSPLGTAHLPAPREPRVIGSIAAELGFEEPEGPLADAVAAGLPYRMHGLGAQ